MEKHSFVEGLPKFYKSLEEISNRFDIQQSLIWKELSVLTIHPKQALPIPGFNILRKFRLPVPGRTGKRKGLRFICGIDEASKLIIPLEIYYKGEKEDLTDKELKKLRDELKESLSKE